MQSSQDIVLVTFERTDLVKNIAQRLGKKLHELTLQQFADGELNIQLPHPVQYQNKTVVIVQSTGEKVNEYTLAIPFIAQLLYQAGAQRIIAVIPYLGYSRQDKGIEGDSGPLKLIAGLFEQSGINELLVVALHAPASMNFFGIPFSNIEVDTTIAHHIRTHFPLDRVCIVAPDQGAQERAEKIARTLGVGVVRCTKERFATDQTHLLECTMPEDRCSIAIIVDDIISTGGTIAHVAELLAARGCHELFCYAVHALFAEHALQQLQGRLKTIWVSNSMSLPFHVKHSSLLKIFDISEEIISVLQETLGA